MSKILYLPLDGRPCNARFPAQLAQIAGQPLSVPDARLLGDAQRPARRDLLRRWLEQELEPGARLCLSLDTWLYGNLVASRKNTEDFSILKAQLELLQRFQQDYGLQIDAFATLLRISNSHDDTEERPYWKQYGKEIHRYSFLEHFLELHPKAEPESQEWRQLKSAIPPSVLQDYQALRQRNFKLLENCLAFVQQGVFERLSIACDDSSEYGWNVLEKQRLTEQLALAGVQDKVLIYPGADELGMVCVARVVRPASQLRLGVCHTWPQARELLTRYEGIPLSQTLSYQAQANGLELIDLNETEPEHWPEIAALLWLHNPPQAQRDQFLERETPPPLAKTQLRGLYRALRQGIPVALADLLYANGGDMALIEDLEASGQLFRLHAYSAWNTNSNSLGALLAWLRLALPPENEAAHRLFLWERLADDGWYQGHGRQVLCQDYREPVTLHSCVQSIASLNQRLREWRANMPDPPAHLEVKRLSFPWKRYFEIDLQLCTKNQCDT